MCNGEPTEEYWEWREKGLRHPIAVRYPNGRNHRGEVLCSYVCDKQNETLDGKEKSLHLLKENSKDVYHKLDYIEARKQIYSSLYIDLLIKEEALYNSSKGLEQFKELVEMYNNGILLQIVEVDGPSHHDSYPYNNVKRGRIGADWIDTIEITDETIVGIVNNKNRPMGHGYVLAALISGRAELLL